MPKEDKKITVLKAKDGLCEVKMDGRGDLFSAADCHDFSGASVTREELMQIAAKAEAMYKAAKALDKAQDDMEYARELPGDECTGTYEVDYNDPENNSVEEGYVAFGCQKVPLKDVVRIAALASKLRKK